MDKSVRNRDLLDLVYTPPLVFTEVLKHAMCGVRCHIQHINQCFQAVMHAYNGLEPVFYILAKTTKD